MKILLHVCCAPCSVSCVDLLEEEGADITAYWNNLNIHPYTEYESRRKTLVAYMEERNIPLVQEGSYGLRAFLPAVSGQSSRCHACYDLRFDAAAKYASENGFDAYTSTLFVSPYQNHEKMKLIAEEKAEKYGIAFAYRDFRPGFYEGQKRAREKGLYMQKYCGCIFSEEERYLQPKKKKKAK